MLACGPLLLLHCQSAHQPVVGMGVFQEYTTVAESSLVVVPNDISDEQAYNSM